MNNPTNTIDTSFNKYVKERSSKNSLHIEGGIPDYAFASDYALRQKLNAIPGVYSFFKAVYNHVVPKERQLLYLSSLKVGPSQCPDIYEIAKDCAKILGIGMPTVFIQHKVQEINAYAVAYEDSEPLIILTSALVERCSIEELKAVIGHECGHIHNNHGIYDNAARVLISYAAGGISLPQQLIGLFTTSIHWALMAWSRAAEVTCDRAGIICCGEEESTSSFHKKVMSGAMLGHSDFNTEEILKQYDKFRDTPVRFLELNSTHPTSVRRMFAAKEFMNSEVYYKWHPEQKKPGMALLSKQELDARCDKYISVLKSDKRS